MMQYAIVLNKSSTLLSSSRHRFERSSPQLHFGNSHASEVHERSEKWLRETLEQDQNWGQVTVLTGSSGNHNVLCFTRHILSSHHLLSLPDQWDASPIIREPSCFTVESRTNEKSPQNLLMSYEFGDANDNSLINSHGFFNDSDIVYIKQKRLERTETEITVTEFGNRTQVHRS